MSRFGSTNYNPTGSSNDSDSSEYKEREPFLLGEYAIIEFTLDNVGVYSGDYGQNMILNMDDVEVREGVNSERVGDGKLRVWGWDRWFDRDPDTKELQPIGDMDTVSADALPEIETQQAGNDQYRYQIIDPVMEGQDEPVPVGDRELWLSNGKKTRTLAKVLSQKGHEVINGANKKEDYGWLNADDSESFRLRPELQDRRIMMWFEPVTLTPDQLDGDTDEPVTFTDTVALDAETETGITIDNSTSEDENTLEAAGEDELPGGEYQESAAGDGTTGATGDGGFPQAVDNLINVFARNGVEDREQVERMVESEAGPEVDIGAVMAEIEARQ